MTASILLIAAPVAAAETCPPIAVLEGPSSAVQQLTASLIDRGIRVEPSGLPPGDCGVLQVKLSEGEESGLALNISDPWGRAADRTVKDVSTAAALVESWARMDLLEGAVTSTRARAAVVTKPVDPAPVAAAPVVSSAPEEPIDLRSELLFQVFGEGGVARDQQKWIGAAMSICARADFACIGVKGRYAINRDRQSNIDLLFGVDTPIALGALTVTPGIGLGAGWSNAGRGGPFVRQFFGDDDFGFDDDFGDRGRFNPRAEARLTASIPLFEALHLQLGGSATIAPDFDDNALGDPSFTILRGHAGLMWGTP